MTKVKILRVLSESRSAFTLQQLKNETELSIGIIHKAVNELADEGVVLKIKGTKKERMFKFNTGNPFAHDIFEIFRIEKTLQRKEVVLLHTWNVLESVVSKIRENSSMILLYGSQARGDATLQSDIDLLIITGSSQEVLDNLGKVKSKNKLSPTLLSIADFKNEMSKDTLYYRGIKSDSILLYIDPKIIKEVSSFLDDIAGGKHGQ
ncbi:nucleotidyltransferase domain-containing protein [Candidatus Woesearchaeota archaeon]|nr:nucleotidyltransferase domain-containing protein [Candidatus Woesearchaeota archaeon]